MQIDKVTHDLWVKDKTLDEVLGKRDEYEVDTPEWEAWNEVKADWLELRKPSNKEEIIYFEETALLKIPFGFTRTDKLPQIPYQVMRRSLLEHHPEKRHPIPYVIVRYKDKYFFILREKGSGELRLVGKKGMLGGHIGKEDIDPKSFSKTILRGLLREIEEEAGIDQGIIRSIYLQGLIKGNEGVDADHLGIVYEIELETDDIESQEDGILKGIWIEQSDLQNHFESFESWSKIVYESVLLPRIERMG